MADVSVDPKALSEGERPIFQASWGKLFMWFFLVSDAFTFSGLLIAYGALRVRAGSDGYNWALPEEVFTHAPILHEIFHIDAPLVFVGLMTFVLILSSVTMVLAVEAGHRKSKKEVQKWVFWTIIGGITFLSCQAYEWYHFISGTGIYYNAEDHRFESGGMMLSASLLEESQETAPKIVGLEDKKVIVFYPGGLEHFYENKIHGAHGGDGGGGHEEATKLGLRNGAEITNKGDIKKLLEHAHHSHDGSFVMKWDEVGKSGLEKILKKTGTTPADIASVKVYAQKSINGDTLRMVMRNGYEITYPSLIQTLKKPGVKVDQEGHIAKIEEDGYYPSQGGASMYANQYGRKAFANLFFFVTGFHGTHVFSGVILLIILYLNVRKGTYEKRGHYEMTEKIGLYWHFVDLVWVFVFTFFYLV
ncbi:MAG: cytochrome c oxidase subunit 3 [Bacteroidia bacterium]|nr:cytochrome c oxidase subunit 3 [Bacteroidia bacterium]